jgi:hypothetical protein
MADRSRSVMLHTFHEKCRSRVRPGGRSYSFSQPLMVGVPQRRGAPAGLVCNLHHFPAPKRGETPADGPVLLSATRPPELSEAKRRMTRGKSENAPYLGALPFALCRTSNSSSQNTVWCDVWRRPTHASPFSSRTWPRRTHHAASGFFHTHEAHHAAREAALRIVEPWNAERSHCGRQPKPG